MRLKRLLSAAVPALLLMGCGAPAIQPKPVLVVTEWADRGLEGPWPEHVRLVVYDSGLVMQQPPIDDPRAVPTFIWGRKNRAEVVALVAATKNAALEHVAITDESVRLPPDIGVTSIEYWDDEASRRVALRAHGMPCRPLETGRVAPWTASLRAATNPRFLALCDRLLGLPLQDAKAWHPREMTVVLVREEPRSNRIVDWPADWPATWREFDLYGVPAIELCVPVGKEPDALTAQILDPRSEQWTPRAAAVRSPRSEPWTILPFASKVSMPGAIEGWAPGPCSPGGS